MVLPSKPSPEGEYFRILPKFVISDTSISVPADSVCKHSVSEFLSTKLLANDVEVRWAVKVFLSHFSYSFNVRMKSLFLTMFLDNAIVKKYSMSKEKVSYFINNGIGPVLRHEMLLTCENSPFHSVIRASVINWIINWMCILQFGTL